MNVFLLCTIAPPDSMPPTVIQQEIASSTMKTVTTILQTIPSGQDLYDFFISNHNEISSVVMAVASVGVMALALYRIAQMVRGAIMYMANVVVLGTLLCLPMLAFSMAHLPEDIRNKATATELVGLAYEDLTKTVKELVKIMFRILPSFLSFNK